MNQESNENSSVDASQKRSFKWKEADGYDIESGSKLICDIGIEEDAAVSADKVRWF